MTWCPEPIQAEAEGCGGHWVLFPYDLAEFVSPWQGFEGGKIFSREDAKSRRRVRSEIAGLNFEVEAGERGLSCGVTFCRHKVTFFFLCAASTELYGQGGCCAA